VFGLRGSWQAKEHVRVFAAVENIRLPFTLGVLQNPYLSQYLDIFLAAPPTIDPESVVLTVGEDVVPMTQIDPENHVFKGDFALTPGSGDIAITVCGGKPGSDPSCLGTTVTAKAVSPGTGFTLASADGEFSVTVAGGAVSGRGFAVVLPEEAMWSPEGSDLLPDHVASYAVPSTGSLSGPVTVEFLVGDGAGDARDLGVYLSGHGPLDSVADPDRGVVRATAPRPGMFYLAAGGSRPVDAASLRILAAAPNPFRGSTRIQFSIETRQQVSVTVHDLSGRLVTGLLDAVVAPGINEVTWDGAGAGGGRASAGMYFIRVASENAVAAHKILLQR